MIKVFGATDTLFSSNGDIIITPIKANNRDSHKAMFDFLLEERDVFDKCPNGTVKFKVGIFAKYLQVPKRARKGEVKRPLRVVAPIRVNGASSI